MVDTSGPVQGPTHSYRNFLIFLSFVVGVVAAGSSSAEDHRTVLRAQGGGNEQLDEQQLALCHIAVTGYRYLPVIAHKVFRHKLNRG